MRSDDGGILSNIDEMGVDPEFVSAFYGMGWLNGRYRYY
jgi:hypothetical protein